jgi:hypothetical protein
MSGLCWAELSALLIGARIPGQRRGLPGAFARLGNISDARFSGRDSSVVVELWENTEP